MFLKCANFAEFLFSDSQSKLITYMLFIFTTEKITNKFGNDFYIQKQIQIRLALSRIWVLNYYVFSLFSSKQKQKLPSHKNKNRTIFGVNEKQRKRSGDLLPKFPFADDRPEECQLCEINICKLRVYWFLQRVTSLF